MQRERTLNLLAVLIGSKETTNHDLGRLGASRIGERDGAEQQQQQSQHCSRLWCRCWGRTSVGDTSSYVLAESIVSRVAFFPLICVTSRLDSDVWISVRSQNIVHRKTDKKNEKMKMKEKK
jgi:hypothetical protein